MGKVIVEQIVSVDGHAEDARGGIEFFANADWINEIDDGQAAMLSQVAALVFGRKTYRMFADYWPSADPQVEPVAVPIRALPKFVVSSTLESAPWGPQDSARILRGDGVAAVQGLRQRFTGDLLVWGSLTLSDALLAAGEVDVLRLRVLPVLLGRGRSFAPSNPGPRRMSLDSARPLAGGVVVLEYGFESRAPSIASLPCITPDSAPC